MEGIALSNAPATKHEFDLNVTVSEVSARSVLTLF